MEVISPMRTMEKICQSGTNYLNGEDIYEPCPFCGKLLKREYFMLLNKPIFGPLEVCTCAKGQETAKDAENKRIVKFQEQEREKLESRRKYSGLSVSQLRQTFETFRTDAKNKLAFDEAFNFALKFKPRRPDDRFFDDAPSSLLFMGRAGIGKTHLASAIANHIIDTGTYVKFKTVTDLLAEIKHTYSYDDSDEYAVMQSLKNVPLLILDDIGKEQQTEWSLSRLYELINSRYESKMPMIITSNYSLKALYEHFCGAGDKNTAMAIISRLKGMCKVVGLAGKDRRMNVTGH